MSDNRLKFRAWCEKLKSYAPLEEKISFPGNIVLEPVVISADGRVYSCNPYGGMEQCELDDMTEYFIIEQCTGLKDKNGKLIYEGDILRFAIQIDVVVTFRNGGFVYSLTEDEKLAYRFTEVIAKETQIIGNIHEMELEK